MTHTATTTADMDDQLTAKELITQYIEFSAECDTTAQAKEEALSSLIEHLNNLNREAQIPDTHQNSKDNQMETFMKCTDISRVMSNIDRRAIANNTNIKGNSNTVTNKHAVYNSITVYNVEALILLKEQNELLRSQLQRARRIIGRLTGDIMSANTEMLDFLA